MKINLIFLLIGLALTIISKILQYVYKSKIGDMIVIPAAVFFLYWQSFFRSPNLPIYWAGMMEPKQPRKSVFGLVWQSYLFKS